MKQYKCAFWGIPNSTHGKYESEYTWCCKPAGYASVQQERACANDLDYLDIVHTYCEEHSKIARSGMVSVDISRIHWHAVTP